VSLRHLLFLGVLAGGVTIVATPFVKRFCLRFGIVDHPGGRKVHASAVPRLGGVALFLGFLVALAAQMAGETYFGWGGGLLDSTRQLLTVLVGIAIVFFVGVIDDVFTLSAGAKFVGQLAAAAIVMSSGLRIDYVGSPLTGGLIQLGLLGIPITLLYITGFTNVINLIDGLDGLAAGVTAISAGTFLVLAAQSNHLQAAALSATLVGACLGFLRFNSHPASIFMGDSGALFLGFTLAVISLVGVMKTVAAIALAVPLIIIGVPIFDTASAIVRRLRHKRPIQEADSGHIHHRLLGRGFDQRQTVLIIYVWSIALAVGGYAMRWAPSPIKYGVLAVLALLTAVMSYWLGLFEAAHHHAEEGDV